MQSLGPSARVRYHSIDLFLDRSSTDFFPLLIWSDPTATVTTSFLELLLSASDRAIKISLQISVSFFKIRLTLLMQLYVQIWLWVTSSAFGVINLILPEASLPAGPLPENGQ